MRAIFFFLSCLLSSMAYGQTRLVKWPKEPRALHYEGNIYHMGTTAYFKVHTPQIEVPALATVEVLALLPGNRRKRLLISRPEFPYSPKKAPLESSESPSAPPQTDVYDYDTKGVEHPEIDDAFDNPEDFFTQTPKIATESPLRPRYAPPLTKLFATSFIDQENLLSESILGNFEGDGVTLGLALRGLYLPKGYEDSSVYFDGDASISQFESITEEVVEGSAIKSRTHRQQVSNAMIRTFGRVAQTPTAQWALGLGINWQQLPFFEIIDETTGAGTLGSKTSVGFALVGQGILFALDPHVLVLNLDVIPLGAKTQAILAIFARIGFHYELNEHWQLLLDGHASYKKLRYPKECSETLTQNCMLPKSIGKTYGLELGLGYQF